MSGTREQYKGKKAPSLLSDDWFDQREEDVEAPTAEKLKELQAADELDESDKD